MRSVLLLIVLTIVATNSRSVDRLYWCNCIDDSDCQSPFTCLNHKCVCPVGRLWIEPFCENITDFKCLLDYQCRHNDDNRVCDLDSKQCVCRNTTGEDPTDKLCKLIGNKCQEDNDCQAEDENSRCIKGNDETDEGLCDCLPEFYFDIDDKRCRPMLSFNDSCNYHQQCSNNLLCQPTDEYLDSGICQCPMAYRWSAVDSTCQPTAMIINCTVDEDCQHPNVDQAITCNNAKCQCESGLKLNSTGVCTRGADRHEKCNLNSDCRDNMTCQLDEMGSSCKCDFGYFWSKEHQKCLLFNDARCQEDLDCQDKTNDLICSVNQKCVCEDEHLEMTDQGMCRVKLLSPCQTNDECNFDRQGYTSYFLVCNQELRKNLCTCPQNEDLSWYGTWCSKKRCNSDHPCRSDDYSDNDKNMNCSDDGYCNCNYGVDEYGRCNDEFSVEIIKIRIIGLEIRVFYTIVSVVATITIFGLFCLGLGIYLKAKRKNGKQKTTTK